MVNELSRRSFTGGCALALATLFGVRQFTDASQATSSPVSATAIPHPTEADEVILRIDVVGGLVASTWYQLTRLPEFALFGDGRIFFPGPQILIYPPPALPNLRTARIAEEAIQQILAEADQAGLLAGNRSYHTSSIADATTTVFTLNTSDGSNIVSVYALNSDDDPAWSDEERTARTKLSEFLQTMFLLPHSLPESLIVESDHAYDIERLQIIARPISPESLTATPTGDAAFLSEPPTDWPLPNSPIGSADSTPNPPATVSPDDPSNHMFCSEIDGDDAKQLISALREANTLTPWRSDGQLYQLDVRPLLPGEVGCQLSLLSAQNATPSAGE